MIIVISYGNNKLLFRNSKYFDFNKRIITLYVSTVNPLHKSSSDDFRVLTFIECN